MISPSYQPGHKTLYTAMATKATNPSAKGDNNVNNVDLTRGVRTLENKQTTFLRTTRRPRLQEFGFRVKCSEFRQLSS